MVSTNRWQAAKRARATKRTMALAKRVACGKEGNGDSCKSNGHEGDGQATATKAMVMAKVRT